MRAVILSMALFFVQAILYAQTMSTVPDGMQLITPCHYTYSCAVAPDGSVWFTEFNHQELRQCNPNGTISIRRMGLGGMFGIAIDRSSNVFLGLDLGDVGNPGKIMKIASNGSESDIVTGITRPRQLVTDSTGNVYFATESPSRISRWNKSSGTVDILADGLSTPAEGVAVAPDGTVYFSEYGLPESGVAGKVEKISGGTVSTVATGFWRGRGLTLNNTHDYIYLCNEADQEDQGNSGVLSKIKVSDGTVTQVLAGIDYPQFPGNGSNGLIYFPLVRDSWIGAYDPAAATTDSSWSGNSQVKMSVSGGTWGAGGGGKLNENIGGSVSLPGHVQASTPGGTVYGWVRLPASLFSLDSNELYTYRCDPEHPAPGIFELPTVNWIADTGSCMMAAIAVREHTGQRWPMTNPGTCTESPAAGFRESPTAFLVFFAWNKGSRVDTMLAPPYKEPGGATTIVKGSGLQWIYAGNPWNGSGQTWLNSGLSNTPPSSSSWAEQDLGAFSGKSKYVYVMWHKNGPYRPDSAKYRLYDYTEDKQVSIIDQTKHADGLSHSDDSFSGWFLLGKKKINITPSTKLRISQDDPVGSTEYLQSDAIMLTDYPVMDNTSLGASDNFETLPALSVTSTGAPSGVGSHWGMQGLGAQYTTGSTTSWAATLDSNVVTDAGEGNYYVDVSWTYFDTDSLNAGHVRYAVNDTLTADQVNQNRSAGNQAGAYVQGNSVGSWSGFYRLSGVHTHSHAHPLIVSLNYNGTAYAGRRLVADMVRFVPVADSNGVTTRTAPAVIQVMSSVLSDAAASKHYPDPFRSSTNISYSIAEQSFVSLKVYSLSGAQVADLVHQEQGPGDYIIPFNATVLPAGVYLYKISAGKFSSTERMLHIN